jgi:hypothetical protein
MKKSIGGSLPGKVYAIRSDCTTMISSSFPTTHKNIKLNAWNGLDTIHERLINIKQSIRRELYIKSKKDK